jgi:hypothetical protein
VDELKRDPTDVELFDFSQSNSEHSRHWFFRGALVIDGAPVPHSLMDLVRSTLEARPHNSVIAFADNSSAVRGFPTRLLLPAAPGGVSPLALASRERHLLRDLPPARVARDAARPTQAINRLQPPGEFLDDLAPSPAPLALRARFAHEGVLCRGFFMVSCIVPSRPKRISQDTV